MDEWEKRLKQARRYAGNLWGVAALAAFGGFIAAIGPYASPVVVALAFIAVAFTLAARHVLFLLADIAESLHAIADWSVEQKQEKRVIKPLRNR